MTRALAETAAVISDDQAPKGWEANDIAVPRSWNSKRAALTTTVANVMLSVLGICTGVMAARLLGPKGRGELAAIQAWPVGLASLSLLGTSEALVYFCAREREQRSAYFCACVFIGSCGALACSIVGFLAMPWLLKAQAPSVVRGARIFLTQIWLYLAIAMPIEVLRAAGRFISWNLFRICPAALWAGILVVAWIMGVRHAVPLIIASVVVAWIMLFPLVPLIRSEVPRLDLPTRTQLANVLRFGLPAVGSFAPRILNFKLDQILMAGLMPPVVLGQYVVAVAWGNAGTPFVHGLSAVLVPDLAGRADAVEQGRVFARISRIAFLIAAFIAVGLLATAAVGIPFFFGSRFRPAIHAAELLALAGGVAGFNLVLSEGTRGLGRPSALLRAELLALVVTVGGLWLFLRPFGIVGAASVSLAAYGCTALWLLAEARMATNVSMVELTIPQWRDVCLLTGQLSKTGKTLIHKVKMTGGGSGRRKVSAARK